MDADSPVEPDAPETLQWRRDAATSRTIRLLWSLGVGTFFAMIAIIVFWRVFDLALQAGVVARLADSIPLFEQLVVALVAATVVTIVAIALSDDSARHLERLLRPLPVSPPPEPGLRRVLDAVLGTLAMGTFIVSMLVAGRIAARPELLGEGGESPFTGLAAATIPLALVAIALASFLRSVGALDPEEGTLYFYDPEQAVDLSLIAAVSSRQFGDATVVSLEYKQPDGQYVAGPRRIVVPPEIADEIRAIVGTRRVRFSEKVARRIRSVGRRLRSVVRR